MLILASLDSSLLTLTAPQHVGISAATNLKPPALMVSEQHIDFGAAGKHAIKTLLVSAIISRRCG